MVERLRNGGSHLAVPALDAQQLADEETIARILGRGSQSMVGQQLDTGVNRLSR